MTADALKQKAANPRDILLPYQARWVQDTARFKIGLWSRQTGKSFACSDEVVEDCLARKTMWVVLSAGERQALEFMEKAKLFARAWELAVDTYEETRGGAEALLKAAEIKFANDSRIIALPANPSTARGYSANLVLDEFAFHEKPDEIWRAIYPSISNPLKRQLKLRIVSTANGKANKFYDIWTKNAAYSKHKVTIYDAVKDGLPIDINELREGLDDPDGWQQEYECEFIDNAAVLYPYELIAPCESKDASEVNFIEYFNSIRGEELYLGIDIGRKHDRTVCWTLHKMGDVFWTREVLTLEKMPFMQQMEILRPRIAKSQMTCIDNTGIGAQMAEMFHTEFGSKVEECTFTSAFKQEIFMDVRIAFQDRSIRVPVSRAVREDLHGVQKVTTSNGSIRVVAPHNDDGHSDKAAALALAKHAAKQTPIGNIYL